MSRKSTRDVSFRAGLEYADVIITLWANDIPADLKMMHGAPVLMLPMPTSDGFFMLFNTDGAPLPLDRRNLGGWRLTVYVPEDHDPDGALDEGVILFTTDETDVDAMIPTVVATWRVVTNAIDG